MAIGHAIRLISDLESNPELRRSMNRCDTFEELEAILLTQGLSFTSYEFEEAVTHLHLKCATYEQASRLMEKAGWYIFLTNTLPKSTLTGVGI
jgi:hypothetical protein